MLRYCTFSSIYTTTWCYATARSLQFTQLRDATLLHVLFNLHNYVMLRWLGWGGGWVGGGMLTCIGLLHLRDATLLHVLLNLHNYVMLRYCTFSSIYTTTWCYATARSLQFTQLRDSTLLDVHRKVKTLVGSEVNPSLRRRCFQYVWRCNLQTCTPLVMLKELAKLVKNNDADNC